MMESFIKTHQFHQTTLKTLKGFHSYVARYQNLPNNIRTGVKRLEILYRKLVKKSGTVMFNLLCLKKIK